MQKNALKRLYVEMPAESSGGYRYMAAVQMPGYLIVNTMVPVQKVQGVRIIGAKLSDVTIQWLMQQYTKPTEKTNHGKDVDLTDTI